MSPRRELSSRVVARSGIGIGAGVRCAGWEREGEDDDDDDDEVCGRNDGNIIARRRSADVVVEGMRRRRDDGGRCILFAIDFKAGVRQFGRRAIPSKASGVGGFITGAPPRRPIIDANFLGSLWLSRHISSQYTPT